MQLHELHYNLLILFPNYNRLTSETICINADKAKYTRFSHRKQQHYSDIKIGSSTMEETNNIKFLEIILN